jgi:hypothetical protein
MLLACAGDEDHNDFALAGFNNANVRPAQSQCEFTLVMGILSHKSSGQRTTYGRLYLARAEPQQAL